MIRRLIILLLIVGCVTEPEVQWVCKVKPDYDGPLPVESPESATDTTTIYSSYEGCDSLCTIDLPGVDYIWTEVGPFDTLVVWPYDCKEIN